MHKNVKLINLNGVISNGHVFSISSRNSQNIAFIAVNSHSSWIFKSCENNNMFQVNYKIMEEQPVKLILEAGATVYKIVRDGTLYRLENTPLGNSSSEEFLGVQSTKSETFAWVQCHNLGNSICSIIGTTENIVYVQIEGGQYVLNVSETKKDHVVNTQQHCFGLVRDENDTFYLQSFSSGQLSVQFMKYFYRELCIMLPDTIFIAHPSGLAYLLPVGCNISAAEPVPIHFDNGEIVYASITPCGEGLVLVYKNGKVVFIYFCKKTSSMQYIARYLSTPVTCAILHKSTFSLVWSNEDEVRFTQSICLEAIDVLKENVIPLRGIIEFLLIDYRLFSFCINGTLAELLLNHDELVSYSSLNSLDNLNIVGGKIDALQIKVNELNDQIAAINDQETLASQIQIKVDGSSLYAQNIGSSSFPKKIWSLMIESDLRGKSFVKYYPLTENFAVQSTVECPLEYFEEAGCESISVSFIGHLVENEKRLKCKLGKNLRIRPSYTSQPTLTSFTVH